MPASCKHLGIFDNWCCRTRKPYVQSNCIITEGRMYTRPQYFILYSEGLAAIQNLHRKERGSYHNSSCLLYRILFFLGSLMMGWLVDQRKPRSCCGFNVVLNWSSFLRRRLRLWNYGYDEISSDSKKGTQRHGQTSLWLSYPSLSIYSPCLWTNSSEPKTEYVHHKSWKF